MVFVISIPLLTLPSWILNLFTFFFSFSLNFISNLLSLFFLFYLYTLSLSSTLEFPSSFHWKGGTTLSSDWVKTRWLSEIGKHAYLKRGLQKYILRIRTRQLDETCEWHCRPVRKSGSKLVARQRSCYHQTCRS